MNDVQVNRFDLFLFFSTFFVFCVFFFKLSKRQKRKRERRVERLKVYLWQTNRTSPTDRFCRTIHQLNRMRAQSLITIIIINSCLFDATVLTKQNKKQLEITTRMQKTIRTILRFLDINNRYISRIFQRIFEILFSCCCCCCFLLHVFFLFVCCFCREKNELKILSCFGQYLKVTTVDGFLIFFPEQHNN